MARVALVAVAFAFLLFVQPSRSQTACADASNRLTQSISSGQCNTMDAVCRSPCREIYTAFYQNCPNAGVIIIADQVSVESLDDLNQSCDSQGGGAGVLKGLGIYSLLLLSLIAAMVF